MCGIIVVDAESFQSTCLGRDAYIYDHCLGYRHNYLLFYQFPNSNLFTHHMIFSREKPLVKNMAPGLLLLELALIFPLKRKGRCCKVEISIIFRSIKPKTKKYLGAIYLPLLYFALLIILYLSLLDLILASNHEGIDNPFIALGASIFCLCRCNHW